MFQSLSILAFISGSSMFENLHLQLVAQAYDLSQIVLLEKWHGRLHAETCAEWGVEQFAVLDVMLALKHRLHCPQEIDLVGVQIILLDHERLESLLYLFF